MLYIANVLFIFVLLRVEGVPSGLKIISAKIAAADEYPFIAKLERQIILLEGDDIKVQHDIDMCTCAVLSPTWTLTAGHCIDHTGPSKDLTANLRIKSILRYGATIKNTANVISTVRHPSFTHHYRRDMQNDIGLLRTEIIQLKVFARISALDFNTLGGQNVTLASYHTYNSSLVAADEKLKKSLHLLQVTVVRSDKSNVSTIASECVARRCVPSNVSTCPADSGGPMLHSTGIIGINTLSMENIKFCSFKSTTGIIDMGIITPIGPYSEWINTNVQRDQIY